MTKLGGLSQKRLHIMNCTGSYCDEGQTDRTLPLLALKKNCRFLKRCVIFLFIWAIPTVKLQNKTKLYNKDTYRIAQ